MKSFNVRKMEAKIYGLDLEIWCIDTILGAPWNKRHKIGFSKEPLTIKQKHLINSWRQYEN